jgi:hypothetical protein
LATAVIAGAHGVRRFIGVIRGTVDIIHVTRRTAKEDAVIVTVKNKVQMDLAQAVRAWGKAELI